MLWIWVLPKKDNQRAKKNKKDTASHIDILNNGHPFPRTAQRGDEPDSVEGHEAGDGRAPSPACTGVPLPSAFVQTAGASRHRASKVAHGHFCQRLLLASARRVQDGDNAQVQRGVLAGQVRPQCCTGQEGTRRAGGGWLACDCDLGMRGEEAVA